MPYACSSQPERLENGSEPLGGHRELFRQHARLADDGHEVGVAVPAWDDVHVQVVEDPGARGLAEVDAHVEAVRRIGLLDRHLGASRELDELRELVAGRLA